MKVSKKEILKILLEKSMSFHTREAKGEALTLREEKEWSQITYNIERLRAAGMKDEVKQ
jgi:hypothetical protein